MYSAYVPDIQGCYTQGSDIANAMLMVQDALQLMLYAMERAAVEIPAATDLDSIKSKVGDNIVMLIACDTDCVHRK